MTLAFGFTCSLLGLRSTMMENTFCGAAAGLFVLLDNASFTGSTNSFGCSSAAMAMESPTAEAFFTATSSASLSFFSPPIPLLSLLAGETPPLLRVMVPSS